jgi:hydroxypyruvate isomerase
MQKYTRRSLLRSSPGYRYGNQRWPVGSRGRIATSKWPHQQSVCRWCYEKTPLSELCVLAAETGLKGIDLLQPAEYDVPKRYGLRCSMGYVGDDEFFERNAVNRPENHAEIERAFRSGIPLAAKSGVANVITFSGMRDDISDDERARNAIVALNRVKQIAEDHGVNICLELLNTKVDHPGYMANHTAWGVRVMEEVNSPNVKLLYDIYHMQIMEGDLIATIRRNILWIGHFHTGGVPDRHELDDSQEVNWVGVMKAIAGANFRGYVAHEFLPTADPLTSLRHAVDLCDV